MMKAHEGGFIIFGSIEMWQMLLDTLNFLVNMKMVM